MNKDGSLKITLSHIEGGHSEGIAPQSKELLSRNLFKSFDKINAGDDIPKFSLAGKIFPCKCIRVYDGDTIHVAIKYNGIMTDFTIRMYGYNSAELRTKNKEEKAKGNEAKEYISGLILGKNILVKFVDNDKYGNRWLAYIYTIEPVKSNNSTDNVHLTIGDCVNTMMVKNGYGVEYFGKGEKKWT